MEPHQHVPLHGGQLSKSFLQIKEVIHGNDPASRQAVAGITQKFRLAGCSISMIEEHAKSRLVQPVPERPIPICTRSIPPGTAQRLLYKIVDHPSSAHHSDKQAPQSLRLRLQTDLEGSVAFQLYGLGHRRRSWGCNLASVDHLGPSPTALITSPWMPPIVYKTHSVSPYHYRHWRQEDALAALKESIRATRVRENHRLDQAPPWSDSPFSAIVACARSVADLTWVLVQST